MAAWLAMRPGEARPFLRALQPEVEEIEVEGRKRWMLADDAAAAARPTVTSRPTLKLLPQYDSYVLGHRQRDRLVPEAARCADRSRPQRPAQARRRGVGGARRRGGGRTLAPNETGGPHQGFLEHEVDRVGAYLGTEATLVQASGI